MSKTFQTSSVISDPIVVVVSCKRLVDPSDNVFYRKVPMGFKPFIQFLELTYHFLPIGLYLDAKEAFSAIFTTE